MFHNIALPFRETVDLRVPNRNFRDFSWFNVDFIYASAANAIDTDTDTFNGLSVSLNVWLVFFFFFLLMALRPNASHGLLNFEVSRSHITTDHSRYDSSGRVISSSPRPLPDNTQH